MSLVLAGLLFFLLIVVQLLPVLAVVNRGGVNLGTMVISAEVYNEPTGTAPFLLQRQLEGPMEITLLLDSAAPPSLPWSAGREVQISTFGWTYRASIIYPGAYHRESERMLEARKIWFRYKR